MEIKEYNYCLRCGRKLKSKQNRLRGYGETCYKKYKLSVNGVKPLVSLGGNMPRKFSESRRQEYLLKLNQLRIMITANDSAFKLGQISEEEYVNVGHELTEKLDVLENEILGGDSNDNEQQNERITEAG